MQHDLQLRAAARASYRVRHIWADQPTFEEAERLKTPTYLEAVAEAQADLAAILECAAESRQLSLG